MILRHLRRHSDPADAAPGSGNPRYVYLIQRLRGRQITMEEATELFALMDGMIRISESRLAMVISSTTSGPAPSRLGRPRLGLPRLGGAGVPDDLLWLAILGAGAGAGVLAAIAKKAGESMGGTSIASSAAKPTRKTS